MKYICEKCSNENPKLTNEEKHFLLLILNENELSDYETYDDVFKNEKSTQLLYRIYEKSFVDSDLYSKLWNAYYKIQEAKYICSKCGKSIHNTFMNHSYDFYQMYKKIESIEIDDLINQISKKSLLSTDSIADITNREGFNQIWLLEEALKQIDIDLYNKYILADKSLQWFNFDEKGGGDGYSELIEYIRIFIVSIVIPGLIWDFTKMGVLKVYQFIRKFRINKKLSNSVNNEVYKDRTELERFRKSLTEEEIKKIIRKEVKKEINKVTKNCKKRR